MNLSQKQIIIIGAAAVIIVALFVVIFLNLRNTGSGSSFTLKIWGIDDKQKIENLLGPYKAIHSRATIEYTQLDPKNYRDRLLNAFAADQGPDIFYLGNRELPNGQDKLAPLDPAQFPNFGLTQFRDFFPTAAEQDFVLDGKIYAAPIYLDTLALLYNRDLFDQAAIASPPKTWTEFRSLIPHLRVLNQNQQIVKAAAAIGGSEKTIDSGTDLLELLIMQNGAQMVAPDHNAATFAAEDTGGSSGLAAFNFYLQFANSTSPYFTWNDGQPNSIESFAGGKTAMIFNYQSSLADIKAKSPFLNVGVAAIPQTGGVNTISYPKYFGLAVSKRSQYQYQAWNLILSLTTDAQNAKTYLESTGRPPALRSLIAQKINDTDLGIFARQALTARSWYEVDDLEINRIMNNAITSVLNGETNSNIALSQAQDQITQMMRK